MIAGSVTPNLEAVIAVRVRGPSGLEQEIEAVIDTGFDGALSLPSTLVGTLALPWRRRGRALLADGHDTVFDVYEALVIWGGTARRVAVDAAEIAPLVGTVLLHGWELRISFIDGGAVTLTPVP